MTWRTTKVVSSATEKKVTVAASERRDPRPRPQTPWPLVQPLPKRVPKPTSTPATMRPGIEKSVRGINVGPINCHQIAPPEINPIRNSIRHTRSGVRGRVAAPNIPLIPAIRPFSQSKNVAEMPNKTPPIKALYGVKFSTETISSGCAKKVRKICPRSII